MSFEGLASKTRGRSDQAASASSSSHAVVCKAGVSTVA